MINLETEQVVSFKEAAERVPWPGDRKPSYETIRRWADRGVRGHKLETARIGGRRVTTLEAIYRFLQVLSGGPDVIMAERSAQAAIEARKRRFGR